MSRHELDVPSELDREHFLDAFKKFDREGLPVGFKESSVYCVSHAGKSYPPPAIAAYAVEKCTGVRPESGFRAGENTKCFRAIRNAGFEIVKTEQGSMSQNSYTAVEREMARTHHANFLLTWNPDSWPWDYIHDSISQIADEGFSDDHWSCGDRRDIDIGDRIFLIRLGVEPRGLVASGHVTSPVFKGPHWDETRAASGDTSRFVNVRFDAITESPAISIAELDQPPLNSVHWHPQISGTQIEDDTAKAVEQLWQTRMTSSTHSQPEGESSTVEEGKRLRVVTTAYERSQRARRNCLQHHGYSCACCDILLAEKYGAVAADFIHVHHKVPISSFGESHVIDPVADLIPVCPTCHSIIHLKNPPLEVEEVRALLESYSA